jgi:glycosyltransferase involved in cell wall biosynthesis
VSGAAAPDPLRVLVWYWGRRGAGAPYAYNVARALKQRPDLEVLLSLSRQSEGHERFRDLGLPTLWIDTYSGKLSAALALFRLPAVAWRFFRFIKRRRIDCVLCTMSHLWSLPMLWAVRYGGAKFVLVVHDAAAHPGEDFGIRSALLRREIRAADALIALSRSVQQQLAVLTKSDANAIKVARLGNVTFAEDLKAPRRFPSGRPFRLLFFGRFLPYKGLDLLLDAFAQLRSRHVGLELRLVGSGRALPEQARSIEGVTVDQRWIQDAEIPAILDAADLVVLPYVEASQSGVVEVAFAAALPSVVTPVGGLAEQIEPGVTGLVASGVDSAAVAMAVERFLNDPVLYEACSREAHRAALRQSDWAPTAELFADVLRGVTRRRAPFSRHRR